MKYRFYGISRGVSATFATAMREDGMHAIAGAAWDFDSQDGKYEAMWKLAQKLTEEGIELQ